MNNENLLQASCRVALASMLHDIGKFAERAQIATETKAEIVNNQSLYCPEKNKAFFTHKHAAYTGIAIDELEKYFPELKGTDVFPFAAWKSKNADDSLINAAAAHHKPNSFLQWIIATADRVASGFERTEFDDYNKQKDENDGKNHYTMRQVTLFEQIHIDSDKERVKREKLNDFDHRYPLKALSPESIFPVSKTCEPNKNEVGQKEYHDLWDAFIEGLKQIPESHRHNLALWLDHFDSCWQTFTHAIPSATAFGTKPEVSLYDHSKAVAAIAVALWRYHHDLNHNSQQAAKAMAVREDWNENKLLLIQADFFGIQNFIFAHGGDSTKKAAKLLRGRSFYVSLITECAALKVLEALQLPSTSQIINAAGKFLIVAPNTNETIKQLKALQQEFNGWFLKQSYGQSGLGLAWQEACCNDFLAKAENTGFQALMKRLHEKLERSKYQHFDLCGESSAESVFSTYLDDFKKYGEPCSINSRVPATIKKTENGKDVYLSDLANDQINIGKWLINKQRLIIAMQKISGLVSTEATLFGFYVHFTEEEDRKGNFGKEVSNGIIRRAFDFSRPESDKPLWNGYARRNISGYVPEFKEDNLSQEEKDKYEKFLKDDEDIEKLQDGEPKTLNHLSLDNLRWEKDKNEQWRWYGIRALAVLKGDIDNLGAIFQNGLEQPTFAKMAALSRQVNNFFAVYLPYLCETEFKNTYIVFAGGDDFFLLGSWQTLMELANELQTKFKEYVADNPEIHFSAGLTVMKPKIPIYQLAEIAEEALEQSKQYDGKNAVTCFKQTVSWKDFEILTNDRYQRLEMLRQYYELSTAYIYGLLRLSNMAADSSKPENSLWRSQLFYRTYRTVANKKDKETKKRTCEYLIKEIGEQGIQKFKNAYQITLHAHLYKHRKQA